MKKKLDTRFPASRIKKIMQADEDVGKIAMAVPLLVSKALELFLQDLCDRTYDVTLKRGKQCVQSFNVFDFLKDTVGKVPGLGGADAANEDKSTLKRRKISEDEECGIDDCPKKICTHAACQTSNNVRSRGRGRGRGRGCGKGSRTLHRESVDQNEDLLDDPNISNQSCKNQKENLERSSSTVADTTANSRTTGGKDPDKSIVTFDLNVQLNENGDSTAAPFDFSTKPSNGTIHEDIPGWSLDSMERLAIDAVQLANLDKKMDEVDEDYDEEG